MKDKLAAQIFSTSVGNALQYCLENHIVGFEGCEATIEFVHHFDTLFDILNSRSIGAEGWKQALHSNNINTVRAFFEKSKDYILSLRTMGGTLVYETTYL